MRNFNLIPPIFILILFLAALSCEKVYLTEPPEIELDTTVVYSFADTIQPIFDNKCINCHNGGIPPNLTAGNSYDALINGGYVESDTSKAEQSLIYTKLLSGTHEDRATANEKQLILFWIKQGALNN
ncbi:MAG: hypothetical protein JSV24_00200 [Bacteroidales bacterium]|nr:MAG: hypothetical protein JSV24_00200 [Bacteroidales bacterium]